jgi:hypothetical protein
MQPFYSMKGLIFSPVYHFWCTPHALRHRAEGLFLGAGPAAQMSHCGGFESNQRRRRAIFLT